MGEPAAAERLACLTMDVEADPGDPEGRVRLLDEDFRLEAFSRLLFERGIPITCFTLMSQASRNADRLNALAANVKVEFAVHSYRHDGGAASADDVERAWNAFGELWNAEPLGYRAPNCRISDAGIDTLARRGFCYDSSIAPGLRPGLRDLKGLRFGREPFLCKGPNGSIVELPIACLGRLRLPFIFSYVKFFGLSAYESAGTSLSVAQSRCNVPSPV